MKNVSATASMREVMKKVLAATSKLVRCNLKVPYRCSSSVTTTILQSRTEFVGTFAASG
jgi:hypothetical protein